MLIIPPANKVLGQDKRSELNVSNKFNVSFDSVIPVTFEVEILKQFVRVESISIQNQ